MTEPLTKAVRNALRSKDDKALINAGVTYESGSLTKEGRKLVINQIFQNDKDLKKQVVGHAVAIVDESK